MERLIDLFFSWDALEPYLPSLLRGFWLTIRITFISFFFAMIGGIILAVLRQQRSASLSRSSAHCPRSPASSRSSTST